MSDSPLGDGWWQASDRKWYPPEESPASRTAQVGLLVTLALICAAGAAALIVTGVRATESCSSEIGSLERGGSLYRPCTLIGSLEVTVLVVLVALPTIAAIRNSKARLLVATLAAVIVSGVALSAMTSSALP